MKTIAIFGKELQNNHIDDLQSIVSRIESEKYDISLYESYYAQIKDIIHFSNEPKLFTSYKDIQQNVISLFSVGGDGTFLDSVQLIRNSGIPVLGFNFGRMGFLSIVRSDSIKANLDEFFNGSYEIDRRSLIKVESETEIIDDINYGLNEICFSRNEPYSMISVKVWVDGFYLNKYWADGLIIATPTGSTAYSLACGGPIICPSTKSFVLSPIASHNLTAGSIVIPDDSIMRVQVECREPEFCLNVDSVSRFFKSSSIFTVRKNEFDFSLIRLASQNFFKTIREKLNWGLDVRN